MIQCYDQDGETITVSPEDVLFRPAAYGVLIENEQVLLETNPETGLLHPPGHILESHETPTQAIKHHLRNFAGLTPLIGPLLFIEDKYLVKKNLDEVWHLSLLYYALDRPPYSSMTISEMEASGANWLPLADLTRPHLQFGYDAIQAGRLRLRL